MGEGENEITSIQLNVKTRDRLKDFGKKFGNMGDTYDTLLNKMMDHIEKEA